MSNGGDFHRRFSGIERLYGIGSFARLTGSHVCVIGIGGVGSWATEALARSGVGRLTLIDLDHVAESNVNRQVHALTDTLGQAKVLAMRDRIAAIHPDCVVNCVEEFITPENIVSLIPACDAVVDAIDQVRAKAALIAHCRHAKIPLVTTGGAGGRTDPARVRVDDLSRTTQDALAAKVRALLRKEYGFPREKKFGIECVFSDEPTAKPAACDVDEHGLHGLSCAGYGSSVCVTAAFGFTAAARALGILAA